MNQLQGPQVIDLRQTEANLQERAMRSQQAQGIAAQLREKDLAKTKAMDEAVAPYIQQYGMEGFAVLNPQLAAQWAKQKGLPTSTIQNALNMGAALQQNNIGADQTIGLFDQLEAQTGWNKDQKLATIAALTKYTGAPQAPQQETVAPDPGLNVTGGLITQGGGGQAQMPTPPAKIAGPDIERYTKNLNQAAQFFKGLTPAEQAALAAPAAAGGAAIMGPLGAVTAGAAAGGASYLTQDSIAKQKATEFLQKEYPTFSPDEISKLVEDAKTVFQNQSGQPAADDKNRMLTSTAQTALQADPNAAAAVAKADAEWLKQNNPLTLAEKERSKLATERANIAIKAKENKDKKPTAAQAAQISALDARINRFEAALKGKNEKAAADLLGIKLGAKPPSATTKPAAANPPAQAGSGGMTTSPITKFILGDESKGTVVDYIKRKSAANPELGKAIDQISAEAFNSDNKNLYMGADGKLAGPDAVKYRESNGEAVAAIESAGKAMVDAYAAKTAGGKANTGAIQFMLSAGSGDFPTDKVEQAKMAQSVVKASADVGRYKPTPGEWASVSERLSAEYSSMIDKLQAGDPVMQAMFPKESAKILALSKERVDQLKTIADTQNVDSVTTANALKNRLTAKYGDILQEAEIEAIYTDIWYKKIMASLQGLKEKGVADPGLDNLASILTALKDDTGEQSTKTKSAVQGKIQQYLMNTAAVKGNAEAVNGIMQMFGVKPKEYTIGEATPLMATQGTLVPGGNQKSVGGVGAIMQNATQRTKQ